MNIKYIIYYIIFEIISYKLFQNLFFGLNKQYDYLEWVYYFYFPNKNLYLYFYLYFIFTTTIFFTLLIWTNKYKENNND